VDLTFNPLPGVVQVLPDGSTLVNVERIAMTLGTGDDHVSFGSSQPGANYVSGGSGDFDTLTVDWSALSESVTQSFYYGYIRDASGAHQVSFNNFERLEFSGGSGNDNLDASYYNNGQTQEVVFHGNGGNDNLYGTVGDDELYGGDGNDTIYNGGGPGDDIIDGGAGDDNLNISG